jgi:CHASE2 domain-containing sensor protein
MQQPAKRPRHLMDPDNPVRPVNDRSLTNVQRWVMSVLTVFTIAHLAVGIAIAANTVPEDKTAARVGLCIIACAFGVIGVAAGLLIHGKKPLAFPHAPWLLLGLVPGLVGLWFAVR